jgi:uncharacterized protein YjbJ (UPF0337 family)
MTDLDDLKQKTEGETDKTKGKTKQQIDDFVDQAKRHWGKLEGHIEENTADLDEE